MKSKYDLMERVYYVNTYDSTESANLFGMRVGYGWVEKIQFMYKDEPVYFLSDGDCRDTSHCILTTESWILGRTIEEAEKTIDKILEKIRAYLKSGINRKDFKVHSNEKTKDLFTEEDNNFGDEDDDYYD